MYTNCPDLFAKMYICWVFSEIRLTFKGLAYVHWTERHSTGSGKNRRTTTRHYSATENYFHQIVPVYGRGLAILITHKSNFEYIFLYM